MLATQQRRAIAVILGLLLLIVCVAAAQPPKPKWIRLDGVNGDHWVQRSAVIAVSESTDDAVGMAQDMTRRWIRNAGVNVDDTSIVILTGGSKVFVTDSPSKIMEKLDW